MISFFPIGLLVAIISFLISVQHLNQSISNYYDFVALFMVLGGTASVSLILLPWEYRKDFAEAIKDLYLRKKQNYKHVLLDCLESIKSQRLVTTTNAGSNLYVKILNDGFELIDLGLEKEVINEILSERLIAFSRRKKKVSNSIRSLAKYPPAFGLMGTVLGLVNVMRGVSSGLDGKTTALEMAIALIATMYGLVVANLLINPAGELIAKTAAEEEAYGEIAIHAINLIIEKRSLLESQEMLNSYVPIEHRLSVIENYESGPVAS